MNPLPYLLLLAAASALLLFAGVATVALRLQLRRRTSDEAIRERMLRSLMGLLLDAGEPVFAPAGRRGRLLMAETMAALAEMSCGLDRERLRKVVERYGLDEELLRRGRLTGGYRRARALALLARLPLDTGVVARLGRDLTSRRREVRFAALTVCLAADPDSAAERLASTGDILSPREVAEVMTFVRRGELTFDWEAFVAAPERNLRAVGLALVREFFIEEAADDLFRLIGEEADESLAAEAVRTLCALQQPLEERTVIRRIASMNPSARRRLARHLASEGYSAGALVPLFGEEESRPEASLVESYKCTLVCH